MSLISEADVKIAELKDSVENNYSDYYAKKNDYYSEFKKMQKLYKDYKIFVYNGNELKCIELNNYYIDNSPTDELTVEFIESFHQTP